MGKKIFLFLLPFAFLSADPLPQDRSVDEITKERQKIESNHETTVLISEKPNPKMFPQAIEPNEGMIDLKEIFLAAPIIYALLLGMSVGSVVIWLLSLLTFKAKNFIPEAFLKSARHLLAQNDETKAMEFCDKEESILAKMLLVGLQTKNLGPSLMIDAMKSEGRRISSSFWQRLTILNDIVMIAPMLGLLGTVIGMFYAFYDINRSAESITALFDGLGIAVGTTVFGLFVAIAAMIFSTTLKYRLVKLASLLEKEALALARLIKTPGVSPEDRLQQLQKKSLDKKKKTVKTGE